MTKSMDLEHAADSKYAKASASFLVPFLLAVIGAMLATFGTLLISTQKEQGAQIDKIDKRTLSIEQRQGEFILDELKASSARLDKHDQEFIEVNDRLERIERVVPLP